MIIQERKNLMQFLSIILSFTEMNVETENLIRHSTNIMPMIIQERKNLMKFLSIILSFSLQRNVFATQGAGVNHLLYKGVDEQFGGIAHSLPADGKMTGQDRLASWGGGGA